MDDVSAGMWFDDLWWDLRVSRNVVVSQSQSDWAGIMLEVSTGPALLDNNVIFTTGGQGGIYESDSNNATIVHNLVMNPVGAALYLSGTGGRHYNCVQVDGEGGNGGEACTGPMSADDVAWLSYGCGLAPTNSTTCKNYHASANIFLGNAPISVSAQCAHPATADGHVCCNTTLTRNAVGKATDGPSTPGATKNALTTTTAKLVGDGDTGKIGSDAGSRWNFTTELFLEIAADAAPTTAAGEAGGPGTDVDFFGRPRAAGAAGSEAGPFQNVSGAKARYRLWPPGGGAVAPPPPGPHRTGFHCPCAGSACCTGCGPGNPCGACGSKQGGHPTNCGLDVNCSKAACDDNTCGCSHAGQLAGCCNFTGSA